ncbi:MAG: CPBP family intramembrane metalloprotease [Ruminococcaceae bacterium]|nr:CPBP family intramembrane metalloprotease [Oscillospiraceae bacterium]
MSTFVAEYDIKKRINRLGWALTIMCGVMVLMTVVNEMVYASLVIVGKEKLTISLGAFFESFFYMSMFLIPASLYFAMGGQNYSEPIRFRLKLPKYLPLILLSGIGVIMSASMVNDWFCDFIGFSLPMVDTAQYMSDPEIFALYMTLSLAPAFAEELLFRGVVYSNLRPYGKTYAILVSSLMFALMHQNAAQLFYTMVAGVILALVYEATDSIWTSILLHMCNNLYAVLQTAILYRFDEASASAIIYLAHGLLIFLGAISTICLLIIKKNADQKKKGTDEICSEGAFGIHRAEIKNIGGHHLPLGQGFKILLACPGMMTYIVISLLSVVMSVIIL